MGTHLNKKDEKNSILKKVAKGAIAIAVVLFLVGMTVYIKVVDSGFFERRQTAMSTENYSVSVPEMSYYFHSTYQNLLYQYQSYGLSASSLGIDTTVSLKEQTSTFGTNQTWFEMILEQTRTTVESILVLCEAADAAGVTLDDADMETVEANIDALKESADTAGYSLKDYIKNSFGYYVRESDVRDAIEMSILASKYTDMIADGVDVSDETLEKEYSENLDTYDKVSYLTYTFDYEDYMPADETDDTADTTAPSDTAADKKEEDDAAKADAVAAVKKYGDELVTKTDAESFKAYVKANLVDVLGEKEADAIAAVADMEVKHASYSESSEQMKWAFSAKAGETKLFADEKGETVTVLLLTAERGRVEEETYRDVYHILFTTENNGEEAETKANEIYTKWQEDPTLDNFKALATEHTEDPGSQETGGLYEDVYEGQMVEAFNDWLFDSERKVGDTGLVETDYGWHIMYYGGGKMGWKVDTESTLKNEAVDAASTEAADKYEISVNEENLDSIQA